MNATATAPKTIAQFKRHAEAAFRRANSEAAATITWTRCESVRWFDNSTGFSGSFTVEADGYRTRTMFATFSGNAIMVR